MSLYTFQSEDGKRFFVTCAQNSDHARSQAESRYPYERLRPGPTIQQAHDVVCVVVAGRQPPGPEDFTYDLYRAVNAPAQETR